MTNSTLTPAETSAAVELAHAVKTLRDDANWRAGKTKDISTMISAEWLSLHASQISREFADAAQRFDVSLETALNEDISNDAKRALIEQIILDIAPADLGLKRANLRDSIKRAAAIYGAEAVEQYLLAYHPNAARI